MNCKTITDHQGNKYSSKKAMCNTYGIGPTTFDNRIKNGWSPAKALTTPTSTSIYDHKGNQYSSEKAMCDAYNVLQSTFRVRIANNWPLAKALTTPQGKKPQTITYKGLTYSSFAALARATNITPNKLRAGLKKGWSIDDIINFTSKNVIMVETVYDHKGQAYPSVVEMCNAYHVKPQTFRKKIKKGYSIEEALLSKEHQPSIKGRHITQKCGLQCFVIKHCANHHMEIQWEDGIISTTNNSQFFKGQALHPQLNWRKNSSFCDFDVVIIPGISETQHLYDCTCKHCGHTYIMTPQQMIAHNKEHMNLKEPQEN